jgi:hypothetical protein
MISHTITLETANAALELNRACGTVYAWRFLAHKGFPPESIYLLLKNAQGPEQGSGYLNTELWALIANAA